MLVWHGRGAVIAAVAFGSLLASELICRAHFHDDRYYQQQHGWPKLAGFLVAAGVVCSYNETEMPESSRLPIARSKRNRF
jgi:hypothetical protein